MQPLAIGLAGVTALCLLSEAVRPSDSAPAETGTADPLAPKKVLIVETDEVWSQTLALYLTKCGLKVETARDGPAMDRALAVSRFDIIILEVALPGEDGLSICRRLSPTSLPIILMSADTSDADCIVGLELGADDYLAKPCSTRELLARIRAVLRGYDHCRIGTLGSPAYRFGGYEVDLGGRVRLRTPSGATPPLTRSESLLLTALLKHRSRILSWDFLMNFTRRGGSEISKRAIDVQIGRLRRKLGSTYRDEVIRTVSGAGYMLSAAVTSIEASADPDLQPVPAVSG